MSHPTEEQQPGLDRYRVVPGDHDGSSTPAFAFQDGNLTIAVRERVALAPTRAGVGVLRGLRLDDRRHMIGGRVAPPTGEETALSADVRGIIVRFYDEINAGNLGVIDELVADDFVEREEFPGISPDKEGVRQFFTIFRAAFPDMRMDAHDVLVDGDLACVRSTMSGTHEGDFMGMPPSGKRFEVTGFDQVRVRDGQVVEHWGVMDAMKMMQQLGAMPDQAPA